MRACHVRSTRFIFSIYSYKLFHLFICILYNHENCVDLNKKKSSAMSLA
jgi:hypothetical protein